MTDYLKSPEYYYKRHVTHEIKPEMTPSMKVGKLVDAMITKQPLPFQQKVRKSDDPDLYEKQKELPEESFASEAVFDEALARYKSVIKEPFFKEYGKDTKRQVILEGKREGIPLCGMADIIRYVEEPQENGRYVVYIDDLKCTTQTKCATPQKWLWHCQEMGYLRQLALYKYLCAFQFSEDHAWQTDFVCRHIVSYKENKDLYKVKLFTFNDVLLEGALEEFFCVAKKIWAEKEFKDEPITWDQAITLPYDSSVDWQSNLAVELGLEPEEEDQGSVDVA